MTEPDVALTDYGLAVECTAFAWLLYRDSDRSCAFHPWEVLFFAAVAVASLAGGTLHGFFLDETTLGYRIFWSLSLLAVGVTSLSGWVFGARLILPRGPALWITRAALLQLAAYAAVVLFVSDAFWIAIVDYLPAALFLLVAFGLVARRKRSLPVSLGAWGLALIFLGSALQQLGIAIHPVYFTHNALYHVVQGVALALIFFGCQGLQQLSGGLHADTT